MPQYFFHLHNSGGWTRDAEGRDLPDLRAVEMVTLADVRELMASDIKAGDPVKLSSFIAVDDEKGEQVYKLVYSDAVSFI